MSKELVESDKSIRCEADKLLEETGLRKLLSQYGHVHVAGSYLLQLMTWRDLDMYVEAEEVVSVRDFFALGGRIAELLRPTKMFFDNNILAGRELLPRGLYWGIRLGDLSQGAWKIDIWMVDTKTCRELLGYIDQISQRLTPQSRQQIMSIKSEFCQHPRYRKNFSGTTIYQAVLEDGVTTSDEFFGYLSQRGLLTKL